MLAGHRDLHGPDDDQYYSCWLLISAAQVCTAMHGPQCGGVPQLTRPRLLMSAWLLVLRCRQQRELLRTTCAQLAVGLCTHVLLVTCAMSHCTGRDQWVNWKPYSKYSLNEDQMRIQTHVVHAGHAGVRDPRPGGRRQVCAEWRGGVSAAAISEGL